MKRLLLLLPLALAACAEVPPATTQPSLPDAPTCRADDYKGLIGQPRIVLRDMALPQGSRIIGPNDAVTMDFRPDRLNFEIGKDGRIAKIGCY